MHEQDAEAVVVERVQKLAASGLWEAVNLPALREKPAPKAEVKLKTAPSIGVRGSLHGDISHRADTLRCEPML